MKPTDEQSIAKNLNNTLAEMQKVVEQFNLVREHNKSEQPKFTVGDKRWWNGESTTTIQLEPQIVELGSVLTNSTSVKLKDNMVLMVSLNSLSPLPEMYVGRKWMLPKGTEFIVPTAKSAKSPICNIYEKMVNISVQYVEA